MSLPPASVLLRASQVAIDQDKPIYLDYYRDSVDKKCCIGVQPDGMKFLVKSNDEYTSTVQNVYKCETCYIVVTENSLYLIDGGVPIKKIVAPVETE
jgi:hypothetical protein